MTKRKASIALDSDDNNQISTHKGTASDNNESTSAGNSVAQNAESSGVIQQNGTGPSSTSSSSSNIGIKNQCQSDTAVHNQNDNSVESNLSSNGNQHKGKKERADNWSSAEIQILHKGIESRREIFYGPPSQATKKNRELAWEAIAREVNAVSTTPRSLSQVMKKFKNEKCRAKRKFIDPDKEDGHSQQSTSNNFNSNNNVSNSNHSNSTNTTNNSAANDVATTTNLGSQTQIGSNNHQQQQQQQQAQMQQHQQSHHMTSSEPMSTTQPSINVVKLAPQNVAKTMIDLPGHMQQIQMPNDDMVLIVPPDMDGLLSGVNIVSDGNGHHHFQKCSGNSTLSNHPHSQHNQHSLQTLNTSQGLVNGAMSNGMMTRTIPFVYSTGNEVCASDHHITQNIVSQASLAPNHIGLGAQNLAHHRGTIDQGGHGQQPHHHHLHHPQQQSQQQHLQQQSQQQQHHHQSHHPQQHPQQAQHHTHQNQLASSHNNQQSQGPIATTSLTNTGGVAVESQLKNLLFNLLLKDGQQTTSVPIMSPNNQDNKHRNDMLAIIASSLTKIEGHLSKISRVAGTLIAQSMNLNISDGNDLTGPNQLHTSSSSGLNISTGDGSNNDVAMSATDPSVVSNRGDVRR